MKRLLRKRLVAISLLLCLGSLTLWGASYIREMYVARFSDPLAFGCELGSFFISRTTTATRSHRDHNGVLARKRTSAGR